MAVFSTPTAQPMAAPTRTGGVVDVNGLDIMAAIQAHLRWKLRLEHYISGSAEETLDAEVVGADHHCVLGKWIHSIGAELHGGREIFRRLQVTHAEFHRCAGEIVRSVDVGNRDEAARLLHGGDYPKHSHRVKAELARLSLEVE